MASMFLENDPYVKKTYRTFQKAQVCLANVGGIAKFILLISNYITIVMARRSLVVYIGNLVFDYIDGEPLG